MVQAKPLLLLEQGRDLARKGDITAAAAKFAEALRLDLSLKLEPETEARHIYALTLLRKGRDLARKGDITAATAKFAEVLRLDPSLKLEPETEARHIYALTLLRKGRTLVEQGSNLARQGDVAGAIAKFEEALALDPKLTTNPEVAQDWNGLCWDGATWNQAILVLDACETAVKLAPDDGSIRDSRGLAWALTGNTTRAADDFEFAVKWAQETGEEADFIESRKGLGEGVTGRQEAGGDFRCGDVGEVAA